MGKRSLCERCNGFTAKYYGDAFAEWTIQALRYASKVGTAENYVQLPFTIRPLEVIKQIATMAIAASYFSDTPTVRSLRRFVLVPFEQYTPSSFDFRGYLNPHDPQRKEGLSTQKRMLGIGATMDVTKGTQTHFFAEVAFPPMGYAALFRTNIRLLDEIESLADVGWFGSYRYGQSENIAVRLPVRTPFGPAPGSYWKQ
jgi:hypothetical protein